MAKRKSVAVNRTVRTAKKMEKVLLDLRKGGTYSSAAKAAGISRSTLYQWMGDNPEFNAQCRAAEDEGTDALEKEAVRRAAQGVLEPVFYQGKQTGTVRKYSDTLLIFLLKGRRPEKFKDHVEVKGKVDHEHEHHHTVTIKDQLDFDAIREKREKVEKNVH